MCPAVMSSKSKDYYILLHLDFDIKHVCMMEKSWSYLTFHCLSCRGCAIHHSFNRAVTVHGVDNLLIKDNVAFNIMGHSFFLEDGGEEHNIFEGNLAIFTRTSSSLLNVDVTPGESLLTNRIELFKNSFVFSNTKILTTVSLSCILDCEPTEHLC